MPQVSTPVASSARTTNGNSSAVGSVTGTVLALLTNVTAVSGTSPSLALSVEWSHDGTNFAAAETPDQFTAITATGRVVKQFQAKGPYYRVVWAITGTTPSFTFSVTSWEG